MLLLQVIPAQCLAGAPCSICSETSSRQIPSFRTPFVICTLRLGFLTLRSTLPLGLPRLCHTGVVRYAQALFCCCTPDLMSISVPSCNMRFVQVPIETSSNRSARRSTSQSGFSIEEVDGNVRVPQSSSEPLVQEPDEGGDPFEKASSHPERVETLDCFLTLPCLLTNMYACRSRI